MLGSVGVLPGHSERPPHPGPSAGSPVPQEAALEREAGTTVENPAFNIVDDAEPTPRSAG